MELSNNPDNLFPQVYHVTDEAIQSAHDQGMTMPDATGDAKKSYPRPEARSGEVVVTKVDPRVLQMALGMTADRACLEFGDDGSVLIKNFPSQFRS